MFANASMKN